LPVGGATLDRLRPEVARFAWLSLLAIVTYLLVTRLVTPGFFEPLTPTHSDVWRYFAFSKTDYASIDLTSPRPLMILALKLLGGIDSFPWFVAAILAPAVLLPAALLRTAEKIFSIRVAPWLVLTYFTLVFSLPSFYELQTLDFGGCLSGIVACLSVLAFRRWAIATSGGVASAGTMILPLLLAWISFETKPTYSMLLAAIPLLFVERVGWKRAVIQSGFVCALVVGILLKDKYFGSPFLDTSADSGSSYKIATGLGDMIGSLKFYLRAMMPTGAIPLVVLGLWLASHRFGWKLAVAFLALSVLAVAPMVAIPRNQLPMYAWFGSSLLLLPLALADFNAWRSRVTRDGAYLLMAVLAALAILAIIKAEPKLRFWYGYNQKMSANAYDGIRTLGGRLQPGERVLFVGGINAYSPFKNDGFIKANFAYDFEWKVAIPAAEAVLIPMSTDTTRLIEGRQVRTSDFDKIVYFNKDSRLSLIRDARRLDALSPGELLNELYCRQGKPADVPAELNCLQAIKEDGAFAELQASSAPPPAQ